MYQWRVHLADIEQDVNDVVEFDVDGQMLMADLCSSALYFV